MDSLWKRLAADTQVRMEPTCKISMKLMVCLVVACLGMPCLDTLAQSPAVTLSPTPVMFGLQTVGTSSVSQTVTLTNSGSATLTISVVVLSGSFSGDFTETNNCGTSLSPLTHCGIDLTFTPTGTGTRAATLLVFDNAADSPQAVTLSGEGTGSCASISDCGYQLLNARATANQNSFFVYQDADSGFNHGFPSGLFGNIDLTQVTINAACVDDLTSPGGCSTDSSRLDGTRGTVFSIAFPAFTSTTDFAGLNFLEPQNYDGVTVIGKGYNLTPATVVQFDVRSPNGAVAQFGLGGCMTNFFPLAPTWTSVAIPIDSFFPPPGSVVSCPPDITSTHILFSVAVSGAQSLNGATVLLDNVQFAAPVPTRQTTDSEALSLPLGTQTFGVIPQQATPFPPDQVNRNAATVYESALTILSLLERGQPADIANALAIANALDYALYHDNHGDPLPWSPTSSSGCYDGAASSQCGLHSAYASSDIALLNNQAAPAGGQAGDVRLAGFTVPATPPAQPTFNLVLDGATGGNNAWAILALAAAYIQSGNTTYLTDAETIGSWIIANLEDPSPVSYGGFFIGYSDGGPPKRFLLGKSTASNAVIYAAFSLLAQIETNLGNSTLATQWTNAATVAADCVIKMWDGANRRFYAGTVTQLDAGNPGPGICPNTSLTMGNDVVNTCDFLDSNSITTLAMAGSQQYGGQISDWGGPLLHLLACLLPTSDGCFIQTASVQSVTSGGVRFFQGFDLVPAPPPPSAVGIAWESTAQATATCNYVSALSGATHQDCTQSYLAINSILLALNSAPFGDGSGIVSSTPQSGATVPPVNQCLSTPFQCIPERVGLAATNWGILADQGFNPFTFPGANFSPTSLDFGTVMSFQSSTSTVTLTNIGTAPLTATRVGISGPNASEFSETDNCETSSPIPPGGSCTINVTFLPSHGGTRSATLTVTDNALASPQSVPLTGTAQPANDFSISISPASQSVAAGAIAGYAVKTTASAGIPQPIALSVSGLPACAAGSYSLSTISSGQSSTLSVSTSINCPLGSYPFTVTVTGAEVIHTASLTLVILAPVALSPASLTFATTQTLGTTSAAQTVTLTNTGSSSLTVSSIVLSGSFAGDFSQTNTCAAPIAGGGSCSINVTFTPTGTGTRAATLLIFYGAGNSPQPVTLSGTGLGSCTTVSDCAYQELNTRVSANQNSFFVYQDVESAFNHGFPSGLFASQGLDLRTIVINAGCVDDPASPTGCSTDPTYLDGTRGTVLSVTFPALSANTEFAGLNIEEPEDWRANGMPKTNGYDLTPATAVQFDVRSLKGSEVQFGIGGCVAAFSAVGQTWTTMSIPISSLVAPSPGGPPVTCPPDISNTHILFTVVTNFANAPAGATTVLLDNIQFTPTPSRASQGSETLSLPLSTQSLGVVPQQDYPIPVDQEVRNLGTIYESSLTVLSLLKRGQSTDVTNAMEIANALDYALYYDNHGDPIPTSLTNASGCYGGTRASQCGLHSGYQSGDIALFNNQLAPKLGQAGDARLAGFSASPSLCGPSGLCLVLDGATGASNAWAILALAAAYQQSGITNYLADAETIGNWIAATLADTSGVSYGGYFIGFNDGGQPKTLIAGKSTADNAVIYAAFSVLAQIETNLGNSTLATQWTNDANVAGDFVMKMFDSIYGRFYAGTLNSTLAGNPGPGVCPNTFAQVGNDVINTCDFLDADSLSTLAMAASPRYAGQVDWTRPLNYVLSCPLPNSSNSFAQTVTVAAASFMGFDLVPAAPTGIAWESTGQATEACNYLDLLLNVTTFLSCAQTYDPQILLAQNSAPFGDGIGAVASTLPAGDTLTPVNQCLGTPFVCIPERVGLAATNWAIYADQAFNPLALASASLSPSTLTFTAQAVGTSSAPQTVTLTNLGATPLGITSITATNEFSETDNCGTSVAQGANCTINVSFTPSASGNASGTLTVTDNSNGVTSSTQTVSLTGTGTGPPSAIVTTPPTVSFGSQTVGTTSAAQSIMITNAASVSLIFTAIAADSDFAVEASGTTCSTSTPLDAGATCAIAVTFTPSATGTRTGTLTLSDNVSGSQFVALTGSGTAPGVTLTPSSLSFGSEVVGSVSTAQTVMVQNTGTSALTIDSIGVSGDFAETNACGTLPATLAAGASCIISVTFIPSAAGVRTGTVTLADNASGGQQFIALAGSGTAPGMTLAPSNLTFGSEVVGSTSTAQTVMVRNTGTSAHTINSIGVSGDFAETDTCGTLPATLTAGASCSVSVAFRPSAAGTRTGTVTLADNASGGQQFIALTGSGTATAPSITLAPSNLAFGSEAVGSTSTAQTVMVQNTGTSALTINSIGVSGDFAETNTCGTLPATLGAEASCTVSVTFTPSAAGTSTGTLTLRDNASGGQQFVALTGSGTAPDFNFAAPSLGSKSVSAGGSAQFTFTVNAVGGFSGPIALSIIVASPPGASALPVCTVSPTSLPGNGTATATCTTSGPAVTAPRSNGRFCLRLGPRRFEWRQVPPWMFWLLVLGMSGAALCRPVRSRRARVGLAAAMLYALVWVACGSGGSITTNSPSTPITTAGNYTIAVIATSGNLSHTVTGTLTVH